MSDLLTALRLVLSGDPAGAVAAIEEVEAASSKMAAATDDANKKMAASAKAGHQGLLMMAGGAALVTGAVLVTVDAYAKQAEAIIQVEKLTGMNAKQSSDFVAQCQAMGLSADGLGQVLGRMSKNVEGYVDGTSKTTSAMGKAFTQLGLSVDDLKGKNAGEVIDTIREKLNEMPAGIERSNIIQTIFGRGAGGNPDLLRFLTATQTQLDEINQKAQQFGLVFTQKQLDQAAQYGAEMRALKLEFQGIAVSIGRELAPALASAGKIVGDMLWVFNEIPGPLKVILAFTPGILLMAVGFMKVVQAMKSMVQAGATVRQALTWIIEKANAHKIASDQEAASTEKESATERTNAQAKVYNTSVTDKEIAAEEAEDVAEGENDAALATNDEALAANTEAKIANAAAGGGEEVAGAAAVGEGAAGAAGAGGLGAGATASAIAAPIVAGILAGMIVQSHGGPVGSAAQRAATEHPLHTVAPHMASGGLVKKTTEGTLVVVGDGQDEAVVPLGGKGGGGAAGGITVSFAGANFYGSPTPAVFRQWTPGLMQAIGEAWFNVRKGGGH